MENNKAPMPVSQTFIEGLIHNIRGVPVILDRDIASLYGVETKRINEQVKRNIDRFPEDFMFQLSNSELEIWKSQNATSNSVKMGMRKRPYAFTETGVAILTKLDNKESQRIEGFFFEGQIFDAYSLISDMIRQAERRIILIDNYTDDRVLRTIDKRKEGVEAIIYTDFKHSYISQDIAKHDVQYPKIEVRDCKNIHDRFLIIDDKIYFIGGSIKDLGKKVVAFSQMNQNPEVILSQLK